MMRTGRAGEDVAEFEIAHAEPSPGPAASRPRSTRRPALRWTVAACALVVVGVLLGSALRPPLTEQADRYFYLSDEGTSTTWSWLEDEPLDDAMVVMIGRNLGAGTPSPSNWECRWSTDDDSPWSEQDIAGAATCTGSVCGDLGSCIEITTVIPPAGWQPEP